jgi:hypothetical protein
MNIFRSIFIVSACFLTLLQTAIAQNKGCKFLNEDCETPSNEPIPGPAKAKRSDAEHLQRCLTHYVQRRGPFRPEGQSDRVYKSKSDMTSMCQFAIRNHNYYWDTLVAHPDDTANLKCCVNAGTDTDTCRRNIAAGKATGSGIDFCKLRHEQSNVPPEEWKVPAGCTSGTCLVTPEYCKYVGYRRGEGNTRMLREALAQMKDEAGRTQMRAVLRVCYGENW